MLLDEQGRYAEAEKTYREALAIQRKVLGQEHPDIVTTLTNLGNTLRPRGPARRGRGRSTARRCP